MKRIKRDIYTGELTEEEYTPSDTGRTVLVRGRLPYGAETVVKRVQRDAIRDDKPWVSNAIAVPTYQVEEMNKAIREDGNVSAYYRPSDGKLVCESRKGRNMELARRGYGDQNAGYGDRSPGG